MPGRHGSLPVARIPAIAPHAAGFRSTTVAQSTVVGSEHERKMSCGGIGGGFIGASLGDEVGAVGAAVGVALVGDAVVGASVIGDAVGVPVGTHSVAHGYPGHAVLTESESVICRLLQSDSDVVPSNARSMFVTLPTSKYSGWSKAAASKNMDVMSATLETSNEVSGWLKSFAPWKRLCIVVTLLVSHARSWLKAIAPRNTAIVLWTLAVAIEVSGWLKAAAPKNIPSRLDALLVSKSSGLLNVSAPLNMLFQELTFAVSQTSGWLKDEARWNIHIDLQGRCEVSAGRHAGDQVIAGSTLAGCTR